MVSFLVSSTILLISPIKDRIFSDTERSRTYINRRITRFTTRFHVTTVLHSAVSLAEKQLSKMCILKGRAGRPHSLCVNLIKNLKKLERNQALQSSLPKAFQSVNGVIDFTF